MKIKEQTNRTKHKSKKQSKTQRKKYLEKDLRWKIIAQKTDVRRKKHAYYIKREIKLIIIENHHKLEDKVRLRNSRTPEINNDDIYIFFASPSNCKLC